MGSSDLVELGRLQKQPRGHGGQSSVTGRESPRTGSREMAWAGLMSLVTMARSLGLCPRELEWQRNDLGF